MTHVYTTNGNEVSVWDTFGRRVWGPSELPDPDPEIPADPKTIAEQIAAAQPTSFVRTWDIAQDGTKQFTTIADAVNAARAVIVAENGTRQPSQLSPYRRHRFRIWPGEYKEPNPAFPSHFALIGMGDEPEDVRIWDDRGYAGTGGVDENGQKSGENIISTGGRSMWVENVWLDHQSDDPEWHSVRMVGPSGNIGETGYTRMTAVFSRVRMTSAADGMAGKCAFDATITHYDAVFDRVWFDTPGQPQSINAHIGYANNVSSPSSLVFHGCSITAGYDFIDDPTLPNDGRFADGSLPGAIPIGIHAAQSGEDLCYWVETDDSVWDVGRQAPDVSVPPRGGFGAVMYAPSQAEFHISDLPVIDAEAPSLIVRDPTSGWLPDPDLYTTHGRVDREIPDLIPVLAGMREGTGLAEREFFGLDPATSPAPMVIGTAGAGQSVTLPAGRVYFVPVELPNAEFQVSEIRFDLTGDGNVGVGTAYEDPATGLPFSTNSGQLWKAGAVPPAQGNVTVARRWFFPGHGRMWVAIGTEGVTGRGAVVAPGGPTVYYADGYGGGTMPDMPELSVLAPGEPYPQVEAVRA